eukprot:Nitzschia sp. Nitz4//scaffold4_size323378//260650//261867//NITZ4_000702-RA/size323378-processed-gene-0.305-mRNA-1//1//CDS//3329553525//4671//frame0
MKFSAICSGSSRCFSTFGDQAEEVPQVEFPNEFSTTYHAPVMWKECVDALLETKTPKGGSIETNDVQDSRYRVFVDGTLGGGGHSEAILRRLEPGDVLLGCDVDPDALQTATKRLSRYMNHDGLDLPHFQPVHTNFGDLAKTLPKVLHPVSHHPILTEKEGVDGVLLDLGVSSYQIDTPERGFAFMQDGPLDMRMGKDCGGITAADLCNEFDAKELQRIFSVYGDEPKSKTIAKAIVQSRPLSTTQDLVAAIAKVTPAFAKHKRYGRTATCARIFQSLRIVVNREDDVLEKVLTEACPVLLRKGGRLVVLSYHSMEDRATKRVMRDGTVVAKRAEYDLYGNPIGPAKPFKPVGKRRTATDEEVAANPRARSASLRVALRQ